MHAITEQAASPILSVNEKNNIKDNLPTKEL